MKKKFIAFAPIEDASSIKHRQSAPTWLAAIPFFILGFVFSLWYVKASYLGDSVAYIRFYDALFQLPIEHWATFQRNYLGSAEPLYRFLIGAGAYYGVERTLYLSLWNGILIAGVGSILVNYRCSLVFSALVLTNYYLIVILGSAERLKFAYIMLVLAFAVRNRNLKIVLAISSPFFHTQAVVQFASGILYYIFKNLRRFASTPLKTILLTVTSAAIISSVAYFFIASVGDSIQSKANIYSEGSDGIIEAVQWALILVIGLGVFKDRLAYLIGMLPMGLLTILFGNRVNVATFALFAALAIVQRKTNNVFVLAVMGYMSFKSIEFISDVARYGTGY